MRSVALVCLLCLNSNVQAIPCSRVKARADQWVTGRVDALVHSARLAYESDKASPEYERIVDGIVATIDRCQLSTNGEFSNRYQTFLDYVETLSFERRADHELGFAVPDEQYFTETGKHVEIPEFLLEPQFLRAVSRYETLARAKAYLHQLNSVRSASEQLIFFSYRSRHLGTPDNLRSFRRLLIVVPGDAAKAVPDKWVQFGVTDPGARRRVRNVSVVSAMPKATGTFNVYFKDFYRTFRRDGSIEVKGRWELGEGDDNCVACHKSGVLPILPARGSVIFDEQKALLAVNERFRGYGSPRFGKYLDPTKLGPGLSSATTEDRERRFGSDFANSPAAKAMVCSSCHHADRLGAIAWPMDRKLIGSYVKNGQMPFGHELSTPDRRELYTKLIEEYFSTDKNHPGILKSWLLGKSQMSDTSQLGN